MQPMENSTPLNSDESNGSLLLAYGRPQTPWPLFPVGITVLNLTCLEQYKHILLLTVVPFIVVEDRFINKLQK